MAPLPLPNRSSDRLAVLQLQRWDLTQFSVQISDYAEAFISPTRKMLLLHSHQSEALLLPLNGNSSSSKFKYSNSNRMEPQVDVSSASKPEKAFSVGRKKSNLTNSGFISGAKSLVWAHCGDAYSHKDISVFDELLLVVSDRGLVIHGFLGGNIDMQRTGTSHEVNSIMEGIWIEWDPSTASLNETQVDCLHNYDMENEEHVGSYNTSSKKWLTSFFTQLETKESDGGFSIAFPTKSSVPSTGGVISFEVSMTNTLFLKFIQQALLRGNDKENGGPTKSGRPETGFASPCIENFLLKSPLKCFQVFSSLSHRQIGIMIISPLSVISEDEKNANLIIVVVVAVHCWGMEWVCAVQLPEFSSNSGERLVWSDSKFSDDLLVCLSTSGLVFFWNAITGCFVASIDVWRYFGLNLRSIPVGFKDKHSMETNCNQDNVEYSRSKKIFRRLLVSFHSPLLAVVDQCGVCYVICADDCISEKLYSFNKLTPHFQNCGFGPLSPWVIAGSEIGCQKKFATVPNDQRVGSLSDKRLPAVQIDDTKLPKMKEWHIRGKGKVCKYNLYDIKNYLRSTAVVHLNSPLRNIIVLNDASGASSPICFSPFGIIRAIRVCAGNNSGAVKLIHTSLQSHSVFVDDSCLNAHGCSERSLILHREHVFNVEAVVCCYQGFLYLASQDGLYIVLPSLHVALTKPAHESIDFLQPSITIDLEVNVDRHMRGRKFLGLHEPWMKELIEKVLLFEAPRVADKVCLLNVEISNLIVSI